MLSTGAGLSTATDARQAAVEAAMAARAGLTAPPSLALVFASPHHTDRAGDVLDAVHEAAGPGTVLGCVGEAVVGEAREVEEAPAVSVWLGSFTGDPEPFAMDVVETDQGIGLAGWPPDGEGRGHILLCDPFTFPVDLVLGYVNGNVPGAVVVGGMASGGGAPGETRLFLGREVRNRGAVGIRVPPGVRVRTVVSQGCRPVGEAYTVTRSEGNVIHELAGRPPLERVRELATSLPDRDRTLLSRGLHIGRVIDEYKPRWDRGDFLIRGVIGADAESGAIAVGDAIPVGETVRFHVRDAASADEDLRALLAGVGPPPAGALLFTCNGRGSRLFGEPDHDAALVSSELGGLPLAGFFCAGELGPVGGKNFLHGFTASLALLDEEPSAAR
ncbi:MAG: FIST signal transduction protein [Actinomycetota bacterium]